MKCGNPWLTTEVTTLRQAFKNNQNISIPELCKMLPLHTRKSIDNMVKKLGLTRGDQKKQKPGWEAIRLLLAERPMTRQEIADRIGCTRANVQQIMKSVEGKWHVSGWRNSGHYACKTPVISLGQGEAAPYPKVGKRIARAANPFLTAAGLVAAPKGATGRVFTQDMQ